MVNMRLGNEKFHTSGLRIRDMGYLKVYVYEKWGNRNIPGYTEGERIRDHDLRIAEGTTQAPELLTEGEGY